MLPTHEIAFDIGDDVNFLAKPAGISLASFKDFDFDNAASWSHIELYAAAVGLEIDINFMKAIVALSYFHPALHDALVEELKTSDRIDEFAGTVEFVECVFKVWNDVSYYGVWQEISAQVAAYGLGVDSSDTDWNKAAKMKRKYDILSVLDAKFQYLLVKFYSKHAKDIHAHDQRFMLWLRRRVAIKADSDQVMAKVLLAMNNDIFKMNRTAMFMS
jgi:hypothetical protein